MQPVLDKKFISQPGIFGWDKIDQGSKLLTETLPDNELTGTGADFGCGYGYLANHVLRHHKIEKIYCCDADYRAVQACKINLASSDRKSCYRWIDLTQVQEDLPKLDWVIMNPPFHEGKEMQSSIGMFFIKTASLALKKGGSLWMVANSHLPYEEILRHGFGVVTKVLEQEGFKVFHARK